MLVIPKLILIFQLFVLIMSAACSDNGAETAHIPTVAGVSRPTAVPETNSGVSAAPSSNLHQEETSAAYLGSDTIASSVLTEVPLAIVEPTFLPGGYPALTEVVAAVSTELPFVTEEPIVAANPDSGALEPNTDIPTFGYAVVNTYPHDPDSHIQGLVFDENPGVLLEGSGLWGASSLRRVDLESGEITQFLPLPDQYFGEGITTFNDRIIQLTWKAGAGFVYDRESFRQIDTFGYVHEGWGITHDNQQLIVSDGTDIIHFWDPQTMQETHQIHVTDEFGPVTLLNELEFVEGEIFANIWQTDTIVRINPVTGQVTGRIDLTGLLQQEERNGSEGVLNGIAYDSKAKRLLVTGKRWPTLYEIELLPQNQ